MRDAPAVRFGNSPIAKQIAGFCLFCCGCLPLGKVPAGVRVAGGRTLSGVFFVPSEEPGRPSQLLASGTVRSPDRTQDAMSPSGLKLVDVYAFPQQDGHASPEAPSSQTPVIRDLVLFDGDPTTYSFASDHRGRPIFVQRISPEGWTKVQRLDLSTGKMDEVGGNGRVDRPSFVLSQGRTRVFGGAVGDDRVLGDSGYETIDPVDAPVDALVDSADDPAASPAVFLGEDLYYVTKNASSASGAPSLGTAAKRSRPGAKPEMLASSSGKLSLTPILGDRAPQLLLALVGDGKANPFALLDSSTLEAMGLPNERGNARFASASSNGHWLLFVPPGDGLGPSGAPSTYFMYDWTTDAQASVDVATVRPGRDAEWRPGHDELWFGLESHGGSLGEGHGSKLGIWSGALATFEGGTPCPWFAWSDGRRSTFTRDGSVALLVEYRHKDTLVIPTFSVGPADDPTAPRTALSSGGSELASLWEIAGGRVLAGVGAPEQLASQRQDLLLVDPATGSLRLIGSGGHVVAVGKTRVLALLGWEGSRAAGDLVLIDLATAEKTVLAENVYAAAVDPGYSADVPAETDRLAPGTRVAFLVRERLESPYDGLWLASLP